MAVPLIIAFLPWAWGLLEVVRDALGFGSGAEGGAAPDELGSLGTGAGIAQADAEPSASGATGNASRSVIFLPHLDTLGQDFRAALFEVADKLGTTADALALVLYSESGLDPTRCNALPACGLNQLTTGAHLAGYLTKDQIRSVAQLSGADQLRRIVLPYFQQAGGSKTQGADATTLYTINFLPAFAGRAPDTVLGRQGDTTAIPGGKLTYGQVYDANKGFDGGKKGTILISDLTASLNRAAKAAHGNRITLDGTVIPSASVVLPSATPAAASYASSSLDAATPSQAPAPAQSQSQPSASASNGTPSLAANPAIPTGLRYMQQAEVTPDMTAESLAILDDAQTYPMFATATQTFGTTPVTFRVEWHAPEPSIPSVHRGVSLFVPVSAGQTSAYPGGVTDGETQSSAPAQPAASRRGKGGGGSTGSGAQVPNWQSQGGASALGDSGGAASPDAGGPPDNALGDSGGAASPDAGGPPDNALGDSGGAASPSGDDPGPLSIAAPKAAPAPDADSGDGGSDDSLDAASAAVSGIGGALLGAAGGALVGGLLGVPAGVALAAVGLAHAAPEQLANMGLQAIPGGILDNRVRVAGPSNLLVIQSTLPTSSPTAPSGAPATPFEPMPTEPGGYDGDTSPGAWWYWNADAAQWIPAALDPPAASVQGIGPKAQHGEDARRPVTAQRGDGWKRMRIAGSSGGSRPLDGIMLAAVRAGTAVNTDNLVEVPIAALGLVITQPRRALRCPVDGYDRPLLVGTSWLDLVEICRLLGWVAPTWEMVDAFHRAAYTWRIKPEGLWFPGASLNTVEMADRHTRKVDQAIAALNGGQGPGPDAVVSSEGKNLIMSEELPSSAGEVEWGWQGPDGVPLQGLGRKHGRKYVDYSQCGPPILAQARAYHAGPDGSDDGSGAEVNMLDWYRQRYDDPRMAPYIDAFEAQGVA